jgi:predicted MFS family arabinose efflux permease
MRFSGMPKEARGRFPSLAAIFLPLACGYLLSYIFRTINGPLADELIRRFSLDAESLGLLTSMYFLAFAVSAIPIGVALDALGPRRVQASLMSVAAVGAIVFALAPAAPILIIGRFLIGLGVAGGLMAGLKAHALWVPPQYLPLANGGLVMFGGLGAIAATLPVGTIDAEFGWRATFVILAGLSTATAIAICALLPRHATATQRQNWRDALRGLIDAVTDRRFWRFAPLSASVVGTAFAIQGLWGARWLVDIEGYGSDQLLHELLAMGVGLTLGAVVIGGATTWLRKRGVGEATVFSGFCIAFIALQLVLLLHITLPATVLWGLIGGFGGMPVLSYSILDTMFPSERVGRANSALNVLHLTTAWLVQAGMGIVIARWHADATGHYPLVAYRVAFVVPLVLQLAGLIWFFSLRQSSLANLTAKPISPDGRTETA